MNIEARIPLLESLLAPWEDSIGTDFAGYRNHVYRMVHFCLALRECDEDEYRRIVIAGCFHDLGIWSDHTVDYLPPSVALARTYLKANGLAHWVPEVESMIENHHKIRALPPQPYPLVEVFRRADLVDVSLGLVPCGVPWSFIRRVQREFPDAGFHLRLVRLLGGWFAHHPASPPPFFKW